MDLIKVISVLLVVMGVVNLYFVWHGYRIFAAVRPPSPVLAAILGVNAAIWLISAFIGYIALRLLLDLPPLPFGGIGVAIAILVVELLPFFIWFQIRRFVDEDRARDTVRDDARDLGRDEIRDPARDLARDTEHDEASRNEP